MPVDVDKNVIEGIQGLMHPAVLNYMKEAGPRADGDYLMYADGGRLRYVLYEE